MPNLFIVSGYRVYFWSNEGTEPIHVHICKGKPSANATKLWLTRAGGCIVANNGSNIPERELKELMEIVSHSSSLSVGNGKNFSVWMTFSFIAEQGEETQ